MAMLNPPALNDAGVTTILPPPGCLTRDEVARRAFEIYRERSSSHGFDIDDWLNAERECTEACARVVSVRLRIKADRRRGGPPPFFDRRCEIL